MSEPDDIAANVAAVRARIADAASRAGRPVDDITLVAAVKTVSWTRVATAIRAGVHDIGENRAQELLGKAPDLEHQAPAHRWHFIGPLQRNKVRALAPWVSLWHSVDRESLGEEIARRAARASVLVEVNVGGESSKAGCAPHDAPSLVDRLRETGLDVQGLMTIPPMGGDPRRWFASLAELAARLELRELSMGMTEDFEIAIEEGATIVRVGRALFGARPTP
jgi:pyridoxal phosphate enzyme (YggS family)